MALYKTTANLNFRITPGTSFNPIRVLPYGTIVGFNGAKSGIWYYVTATGSAGCSESGWVSSDFLAPLNPTPPPPTSGLTPSRQSFRFGLHVTGDAPISWDMFARLHQAEKPVPGVTLVDAGHAIHMSKISPLTWCLVRAWPDNNPTFEDPVGWFNEMMGRFGSLIDMKLPRVIFQLTNEWCFVKSTSSDVLQKQTNFWMKIIDMANQRGIRISTLDLSVGAGGIKEFGDPDHWEYLEPILKATASGGHVCNYHMYGPESNAQHNIDVYDITKNRQYYAMRWLYWADRVPGLVFVGGESLPFDGKDLSGQDAHFRSTDDFLRMGNELDTMISNSNMKARVLFHAGWSITHPDDQLWKRFNATPALQAYEQLSMNSGG